MNRKDFIHPEMDEEIRSISGRYGFNREDTVLFGDREVLYFTGYSVTDSTCCGVGGCYFSLVPGYLTRRHYRTTPEGRAVSEVEPIVDEQERKEVTRLLTERERCIQVNFL
ncbi:MAG TPA: hypothetical protein ENN21_06130 [Spirochaetes bacterium]|nr:hypothetical protein [Spirochaetota bacterium]